MKGIRYLLLALVVMMFSCSKSEVNADVTACIQERISEFKNSDMICDDAVVTKYLFQKQYVYVFDSSCCCDWIAGVVDADCNVIGGLGGFAGNTEINGEDFSNAEFIREVWRNPRSESADR